MTTRLEKLLGVSSDPIRGEAPELTPEVRKLAGGLADELLQMLRTRNGFYAFESALRVLPDRSVGDEYGLAEWNAPDLWIDGYKGDADGILFFAEDVFGHPFAIKDGVVFTFDPESAERQDMASSLEGWADELLKEYDFLTGWWLASAWQKTHGPLTPGKRLFPKQPFMFGGEFEVDNLYEGDPVERMRFRAHMWDMVRDAEDGQQFVILATR